MTFAQDFGNAPGVGLVIRHGPAHSQIMPTQLLAQLYPDHLATLQERTSGALQRAGFDHLVIASGTPAYKFLDDMPYPYVVNPQFKAWLPVTKAPGSWLVITPGQRPKLIYLQPHDYWHAVAPSPSGYWVEHFDITIIRESKEALGLLPKDLARCAVVGEATAALDGVVPNNPPALLNYLHWHRSWKTEYELAMMRVASKLGVRAHLAAEAAFRRGESEYGIHMAYLGAAHETDNELPYTNIIALNEHAAVLHYTELERNPPVVAHSFLIDAGASFHGYASDITRTCAGADAAEFQALIDAMDQAQRGFCAKVRKGQKYADLHVHAHYVLAQILRDFGLVRSSAEGAVETGITSTFFPHGLGHYIGLQVHDVGGFQENDAGGFVARPPGHPYLRLTRTLDAGQVMTIEPGLYFIDMLLAELKRTPASQDVNWDKVDAFRRYGGIRIEDDVVCTDGEPENLTRDAFAAAA